MITNFDTKLFFFISRLVNTQVQHLLLRKVIVPGFYPISYSLEVIYKNNGDVWLNGL